jgi:phosphoribosylamine--glycine ligase
MRVLVIGSGGREHAMLWAMARGGTPDLELFCAPGNGGIGQIARCVPIGATDVAALADFAEQNRIDLTVAGGESTLAAGAADEFARRGLAFAGASQAAAQLESSKAFAKDFMARHGIPTAQYRVAVDADDAIRVLRRDVFGDKDAPVVIKLDGLAAGKGVVVARNRAEAEAAVHELAPGGRLVLEEALIGREVSLLVFADGKDYAVMPAARDHKRIGEGDTGPNTGGMGAVTGDGILDHATLQTILRTVIEPTLKGAADEGFPFRGVLFAGLMLTRYGVRTLEFNVRFGDPEAQAILVRLRTDLVSIMDGVAHGTLGELKVEWSPGASACVVLAARGYPAKPETGSVIHGLDQIPRGVEVFHAGTALDENGKLVTAGGRVLGVTSSVEGNSRLKVGRRTAELDTALNRCYAAIAKIGWDGMQYRRDIGRN